MRFNQKVSSILIAVLLMVSVATIMGLNRTPAASATFPGPNGRIVFESQRDGNPEIYVMNVDGSAQTRLTNNNSTDTMPRWSPDNSKIAFVSDRDGNKEIYVMNADGTGQVNLSNNSTAIDSSPTWSPDGKKIAFVRGQHGPGGDSPGEIYSMNATDGSGQTRLTHGVNAIDVSWSPDGKKMAFTDITSAYSLGSRIFVMNADGTGQVNVSNNNGSFASDLAPNWSPDSSKITFTTAGRIGPCCEIFTMNADGSNKTRVTPGGGSDFFPSWSPDGKEIAFGGSFSGPPSDSPDMEIYTVNADGSSNTLKRLTVNDVADSYPDWGSAPNVEPPAHSTLTVKSGTWVGHKEFSGIWATIRSMNGTLLKSGYTPLTFVGNTGEQYKVSVENYDGKVFDFWGDGAGDVRTRTVTLTSDVTLRAIYDLGDSLRGFTSLTYTGEEAGQPNLTVNAALTNNTSKTLHMWMVIDPQSTNSSGTTYKVYATNGYQNLVFDHWGDNGSTDRIRTITIREATTITAYYKQGVSTVSFSAHYHDVDGPGTPVCDDVISGSCGPFFGNAEESSGTASGTWSQHMPRGALCSIGGPIGDMSTNGTTFTLTGKYTGTCDSFDPGSAVTVTGMCGANSEITFTIGGARNKFIGDSTCSA